MRDSRVDVIKRILKEEAKKQPNLDSDTEREHLANKILEGLSKVIISPLNGKKMKPVNYPKYPEQ